MVIQSGLTMGFSQISQIDLYFKYLQNLFLVKDLVIHFNNNNNTNNIYLRTIQNTNTDYKNNKHINHRPFLH